VGGMPLASANGAALDVPHTRGRLRGSILRRCIVQRPLLAERVHVPGFQDNRAVMGSIDTPTRCYVSFSEEVAPEKLRIKLPEGNSRRI
jgi:hypothetical protein